MWQWRECGSWSGKCDMTAVKRIQPIILTVVGGAVLAFGLAVAGLIGLAVVLIRGALGILAMESERAKRRLGSAKNFLMRTNSLAKKKTA